MTAEMTTGLDQTLLGVDVQACSSMVEVLVRRSVVHPERRFCTFVNEHGQEDRSLSYGELDRHARIVAARLSRSVAPGDRALLLFPPGLDFIIGFFGCLYAGVVAVPFALPGRRQSPHNILRVMADCQVRIVLTDRRTAQAIGQFLGSGPAPFDVQLLAVDDGAELVDPVPEVALPDPGALALLQYTSGSTTAPRGVMVSHGNLMANERMIREGFKHTSESTFVGWVPHYHDQGLIGNILQPLYIGAFAAFMSPVTFLKRPISWLQAISRYRAHTSGGPNFGYDLCIRSATPENVKGLDLSSWVLAFNGAEPIRAETLQRFCEVFAPCGFRPESWYPCYGMAEATLLASGGAKHAAPVVKTVQKTALQQHHAVRADPGTPDSQMVVGCGRALCDERIVVVDPVTHRVRGPGEVGEIWISGSNIASGYWMAPEQTRETFGAHLADTEEGAFLRTGDLGFLDEDGELYVTGRKKDLIILFGRNHYPHDIEKTVEQSHPAFRPGCVVAFTVGESGDEQLVVVQEVDPEYAGTLDVDTVTGGVRKAVAAEHAVTVHTVFLAKAGSVPKTTSGKVQRQLSARSFVDRKIPAWNS